MNKTLQTIANYIKFEYGSDPHWKRVPAENIYGPILRYEDQINDDNTIEINFTVGTLSIQTFSSKGRTESYIELFKSPKGKYLGINQNDPCDRGVLDALDNILQMYSVSIGESKIEWSEEENRTVVIGIGKYRV